MLHDFAKRIKEEFLRGNKKNNRIVGPFGVDMIKDNGIGLIHTYDIVI